MSPPKRDTLRLVSYADLASAWQLSVQTIRRWVHEDETKGIRIPRSRRRIAQTHRYIVVMRVGVAEELLLRHQPELVE